METRTRDECVSVCVCGLMVISIVRIRWFWHTINTIVCKLNYTTHGLVVRIKIEIKLNDCRNGCQSAKRETMHQLIECRLCSHRQIKTKWIN